MSVDGDSKAHKEIKNTSKDSCTDQYKRQLKIFITQLLTNLNDSCIKQNYETVFLGLQHIKM